MICFQDMGLRRSFFGDTPVGDVSMWQKILRPIKKLVVALGIMPRSMGGKKFLKRIVFGGLVEMPAEITAETSQYIEPTRISSSRPDSGHKVIYCMATLDPQITQINADFLI